MELVTFSQSLEFFPQIEPWASAQYLGLSLVIISFYTLFKTLEFLFESSTERKYLRVSIIAAFFSPFAIMQFQYFMFGQMLAIPVMYFLIYRLSSVKDVNSQISLIMIPLFFFVAYPAMFFLSIASIFLSYTSIAFILKESFLKYVSRLIILYGLTIFSIFISSGSAIKSSFERFLIWTVTNADTSRDLTWSTLKIFSQFSSDLFLPLVAGFIPYPSKIAINPIFITVLWALGAIVFVVTFNSLKSKVSNSNSLIAVLCVHGTLLGLIVFAFLLDEPYLIMKLTTWFFPLFFSIFVIWILEKISELKSGHGVCKLETLTLGLLAFTLVGTTSFTYLDRTTSWTNFPNIVKPNEYSEVSKAGEILDKSLLISSPTIEESIWLSGQLGEKHSSRLLGIQDGGQSLGVGNRELLKLRQKYLSRSWTGISLFWYLYRIPRNALLVFLEKRNLTLIVRIRNFKSRVRS